jgi:hypothetical protein
MSSIASFLRCRILLTTAAASGALLLASAASATTLTISDLQLGAVHDQNLAANGAASGGDAYTSAFAQTDFGLNRLFIDAGGRPAGAYNTYVTSLWGENFQVGAAGAGPVHITFTVSVDGATGPLVGEGSGDPPFNFIMKAIKGRATGFDTAGSIDGVPSYEDVSVRGVPVDGPDTPSPLLLGVTSLCPIAAADDGVGCTAGAYPPTFLQLNFTVDPGDPFFVFGALMVEDLVSGKIDFAHTAKILSIAALNDDGDPVILTSDSGRLTSLGDGRYGIAAVPEPAAWAMMLLGLGGIGAALRSRRSPRLAVA